MEVLVEAESALAHFQGSFSFSSLSFSDEDGQRETPHPGCAFFRRMTVGGACEAFVDQRGLQEELSDQSDAGVLVRNPAVSDVKLFKS